MCFVLGQTVTKRGQVSTGFCLVSLPELVQAVRKNMRPYLYLCSFDIMLVPHCLILSAL